MCLSYHKIHLKRESLEHYRVYIQIFYLSSFPRSELCNSPKKDLIKFCRKRFQVSKSKLFFSHIDKKWLFPEVTNKMPLAFWHRPCSHTSKAQVKVEKDWTMGKAKQMCQHFFLDKVTFVLWWVIYISLRSWKAEKFTVISARFPQAWVGSGHCLNYLFSFSTNSLYNMLLDLIYLNLKWKGFHLKFSLVHCYHLLYSELLSVLTLLNGIGPYIPV